RLRQRRGEEKSEHLSPSLPQLPEKLPLPVQDRLCDLGAIPLAFPSGGRRLVAQHGQERHGVAVRLLARGCELLEARFVAVQLGVYLRQPLRAAQRVQLGRASTLRPAPALGTLGLLWLVRLLGLVRLLCLGRRGSGLGLDRLDLERG